MNTSILSTRTGNRLQPLLGAFLLAAAALSGCAAFPMSADSVADDAISAQVQSQLTQRADLEALNVQTVNGVVYLSGTVISAPERQDAEDVALATRNVARVVNSISVYTE